jgi:hypothetical protein
MNRSGIIVFAFLLGSCASVQEPTTITIIPQPHIPAPINTARVFQECDTLAFRVYPVKKLISKSVVSPSIVCDLTDQVRCTEKSVQKMSEYDSNEKKRKEYMITCLRSKLGA